jgi:hypothetical protein
MCNRCFGTDERNPLCPLCRIDENRKKIKRLKSGNLIATTASILFAALLAGATYLCYTLLSWDFAFYLNALSTFIAVYLIAHLIDTSKQIHKLKDEITAASILKNSAPKLPQERPTPEPIKPAPMPAIEEQSAQAKQEIEKEAAALAVQMQERLTAKQAQKKVAAVVKTSSVAAPLASKPDAFGIKAPLPAVSPKPKTPTVLPVADPAEPAAKTGLPAIAAQAAIAEPAEPAPKPPAVKKTWECDCGKVNFTSKLFCMQCGMKRTPEMVKNAKKIEV